MHFHFFASFTTTGWIALERQGMERTLIRHPSRGREYRRDIAHHTDVAGLFLAHQSHDQKAHWQQPDEHSTQLFLVDGRSECHARLAAGLPESVYSKLADRTRQPRRAAIALHPVVRLAGSGSAQHPRLARRVSRTAQTPVAWHILADTQRRNARLQPRAYRRARSAGWCGMARAIILAAVDRTTVTVDRAATAVARKHDFLRSQIR